MTATAPLLPQHVALIRASGISEDVARERGYESVTAPIDLGRRGFGELQRNVPALLLAWDVTGRIGLYQCRPDRPRTDEKGRAIKYETARKATMCLDVPPRSKPNLGDPRVPLWITEGIRKADAAVSRGLCCIDVLGVWNWRGKNEDGGLTALPDWDSIALNGRDVYLTFDSDVMTNPKVRAALVRFKAFLGQRGARVRLVYLPPGPDGGKVGLDDYLAAGHSEADLLALATETLAPLDDGVAPPPFPLDVFPPAVRRYIADSAEALGVVPDLIAVPFLAMAGGAIGHSRALVVKPGWVERPILWAAVIALPGSGKTPGLAVARHPLDALQQAAWEKYQQELADWQAEASSAKAAKEEEPPRPQLEHFHTVDATVEALSRILAHSAGATLIRDELAGWVKSHDAYRKGGDREAFLYLWAGQPLKVDRRSAEPLFVPRPVLCVTGGIQPDRLPELRGDGEALDGFIDRFIFAYPETQPHLWTEAEPDPADRRAVERIFARLRVSGDESLIRLSPEARRVFAAWYNDNARHVAASRHENHPQLGRDDKFGKTRLTKLLFWADFEWYRHTGKAIAGGTYIKMPYGPMLDDLDNFLDGMHQRSLLDLVPQPSGGIPLWCAPLRGGNRRRSGSPPSSSR